MTDDLKVKIAAYIAGNLSSEEVDILEKAMANDSELKEEVALERQIYLHLNGKIHNGDSLENEYTQSLRSVMRSHEAKELNTKLLKSRAQYRNKNKKRRNFKALLAAAVITVLLIAGKGLILTKTQTPGELFDQYYRTEDLPSFRKRGTDKSTLQEAITLFNNYEYKEALGLFNTYMDKEEDVSLSIHVYSGISYAALEDEQRANEEFDKLINSKSIDRSKGLWFKALSYLKLGNKERAIEALEMLKNKRGFKYKETTLLLEQLD